MSHLLGAEELELSYPTRKVFDAVSLGIQAGDRIGIVGRNGDGKSSLLRLLARQQEPDAGRVTWRQGLRVGVLSQQDELDPQVSVRQVIVGDRPEYVWASDPRIRDILAGLVGDLAWEAPVNSLSGGQRRRVSLAALLVQPWDVLMLDEPTNHLDLLGVHWLARHLKDRWPTNQGGLLLITHDRWFLDEVCTSTWEVHDRVVEPFEGGYAAYVLQRVERDRQAAVTETKRANLARKELAWLRRGAPARTAKPKFRIEAANALIQDVPPPRDRIELSKLATARLGKTVVDLVDVIKTYEGETSPVLQEVTWRIAPGERTGILGANGAGKSTLLGLISGTIEPTAGRIKHGKTVQLAVLDQQFSQLEDIKADRVREVLARTKASFMVDGKELTPAQLLERLGFSSQHLSARVQDLSGGQQRRLQLLLVLLAEPNVLILDEPTNDVDTDMLTAMEDLLDSWPGTLIVVSHDRYLLERVTDQQYAILNGTLQHLPGGVDEYLAYTASPQPTSPSSTSTLTSSPGDQSDDSIPTLSGAQRRSLQKELAANERRQERIAALIRDIHLEIADHDQSDFVGLQNYTHKLQELEDEQQLREDEWLELSEQLEDAH